MLFYETHSNPGSRRGSGYTLDSKAQLSIEYSFKKYRRSSFILQKFEQEKETKLIEKQKIQKYILPTLKISGALFFLSGIVVASLTSTLWLAPFACIVCAILVSINRLKNYIDSPLEDVEKDFYDSECVKKTQYFTHYFSSRNTTDNDSFDSITFSEASQEKTGQQIDDFLNTLLKPTEKPYETQFRPLFLGLYASKPEHIPTLFTKIIEKNRQWVKNTENASQMRADKIAVLSAIEKKINYIFFSSSVLPELQKDTLDDFSHHIFIMTKKYELPFIERIESIFNLADTLRELESSHNNRELQSGESPIVMFYSAPEAP